MGALEVNFNMAHKLMQVCRDLKIGKFGTEVLFSLDAMNCMWLYLCFVSAC